MLIFAAVIQQRLKLTHLLLFNFNLYGTLFCQNTMFRAVTALLLYIIGVLGIILNTMCYFLIAHTKGRLGGSLQLCTGRSRRPLLKDPPLFGNAQAQVYFVFLLMAKSSK